jgi:hypothetical protein
MSDRTPIPDFVREESTGRLSRRVVSAVTPGGAWDAASSMPPENGDPVARRQGTATGGQDEPIGGLNPAEFLDEVAIRLARRVPSGPIPQKTYFGLSSSEWTKTALGWLVAALVFLGGWWLSVRDGLRERPTNDQLEQKLEKVFKVHGEGVHVQTKQDIEDLRRQTTQVRESQIRIEEVDQTQTETLKEIRDDVKQLRKNLR